MSVRRRDERGAVFPMAILLMGVTLTMASLVVDIGGDRVVRRDMQSVADVVALDMVRSLDGRTAGSYEGFDASGPSTTLLASEKNASVARQDGLIARPDSVAIQLAVADKDTGDFQHYAAAGEVPNAVRVFASGSSAFRFLPTTPRSEGMQRSALAVIGPAVVCISAGATLADLTPGGTLDVLLGKLIGIEKLSVVSPDGIAALDAQIPLGDLATHLGVGTVDQIATANITGRALLVAAADVLSNDGQVAGANLLDLIAAHVDGTTNITVSDILNLATGAGSAADLELDAFSLVQAVIEVANKNHAVDVTAGIPGLASAKATVIAPPQIACGPVGTKAKSSQVTLEVEAGITNLPGKALEAGIKPLTLTVASGSGEIRDIVCDVDETSLMVETVSSPATFALTIVTKVRVVVVLVPVDLTLQIDVPNPDVSPHGATIGGTNTDQLTFSFPVGTVGLPGAMAARPSTVDLNASTLTPRVQVLLGNISLSLLNSLLAATVQGLLSSTDTLLNPILTSAVQGLGLSLGSVQVQPTSRPACNEPVLRD